MSSSPLELPDTIAALAPFWQGSAEDLQMLQESLGGEFSLASDLPATDGPWSNPLQDLVDEPPSEESFLTIFVDETLLTLDDLTELLLAHEGGGTHDEVEQLVAIFHRIKGSAAMVGLKRAAKLAHAMEDTLQHLRDTGGVLRSELIDAVLKSSDALREYVLALQQGIGHPDRLGDAAEELHRACMEPAATELLNPAATARVDNRSKEVVASPPLPAISVAANESQVARPAAADEARRGGGETMRVEVGHLDRLMGLAGQLTIQNARFHSIINQFRDDPTDRFRTLFEAIHQLDRISDGIRRGVMDVRMMPIGPLLNRYHRVVRDLTRASGKLGPPGNPGGENGTRQAHDRRVGRPAVADCPQCPGSRHRAP